MTMPTPLGWNARRDWGLDLNLAEPEVWLLRDHVTLISDLARDWSSSYSGDYLHFVPNHYSFRINLLNYGMHLYLNDFNVVDSPLSRSENGRCKEKRPTDVQPCWRCMDLVWKHMSLWTVPVTGLNSQSFPL